MRIGSKLARLTVATTFISGCLSKCQRAVKRHPGNPADRRLRHYLRENSRRRRTSLDSTSAKFINELPRIPSPNKGELFYVILFSMWCWRRLWLPSPSSPAPSSTAKCFARASCPPSEMTLPPPVSTTSSSRSVRLTHRLQLTGGWAVVRLVFGSPAARNFRYKASPKSSIPSSRRRERKEGGGSEWVLSCLQSASLPTSWAKRVWCFTSCLWHRSLLPVRLIDALELTVEGRLSVRPSFVGWVRSAQGGRGSTWQLAIVYMHERKSWSRK